MTSWTPPPSLADTMGLQCGVVSRRQLLAAGLRDHDVRRLVRQRRLRAWHPGVYLDHTGEPTWVQRAWAAVLALWPAALHGTSAIRAIDGPGGRGGADGPVHVAIDRRRSSPAPLEGVSVHHVPRLHQSAQWHTSPPRRRLEEAVLDVALAAPDELAVISALARPAGAGAPRPPACSTPWPRDRGRRAETG